VRLCRDCDLTRPSAGTLYFNQDGSIKRFVSHPSFSTVLSSASTTIETADRGVDKITANADGTLNVHGTGIHFRVNGEAYAVGLWRITVDPATDETISAEYHGNFGLETARHRAVHLRRPPKSGRAATARLGRAAAIAWIRHAADSWV
jgi:hypothetical protein